MTILSTEQKHTLAHMMSVRGFTPAEAARELGGGITVEDAKAVYRTYVAEDDEAEEERRPPTVPTKKRRKPRKTPEPRRAGPYAKRFEAIELALEALEVDHGRRIAAAHNRIAALEEEVAALRAAKGPLAPAGGGGDG